MTREEFVRRWARGEASMADDLTTLLNAERAAAREEQRKVDALAIYGPAVAEVAARVEKAESALLDVHDALHAECDGSADLAAEVRALRASAEKAEAALAELRDWPCEGVGCEVTLGTLESTPEGPGGGCWFCASCWNKALPSARRHGAEAQREACARDFEKYIASSTTDDWVRERPPPSEHPSVRRIRATPLVTDKEPKR